MPSGNKNGSAIAYFLLNAWWMAKCMCTEQMRAEPSARFVSKWEWYELKALTSALLQAMVPTYIILKQVVSCSQAEDQPFGCDTVTSNGHQFTQTNIGGSSAISGLFNSASHAAAVLLEALQTGFDGALTLVEACSKGKIVSAPPMRECLPASIHKGGQCRRQSFITKHEYSFQHPPTQEETHCPRHNEWYSEHSSRNISAPLGTCFTANNKVDEVSPGQAPGRDQSSCQGAWEA